MEPHLAVRLTVVRRFVTTLQLPAHPRCFNFRHLRDKATSGTSETLQIPGPLIWIKFRQFPDFSTSVFRQFPDVPTSGSSETFQLPSSGYSETFQLPSSGNSGTSAMNQLPSVPRLFNLNRRFSAWSQRCLVFLLPRVKNASRNSNKKPMKNQTRVFNFPFSPSKAFFSHKKSFFFFNRSIFFFVSPFFPS